MHTVLVIVDGQEKELQVEGKETIYHEVEAQGLDLPHGCLAGSCGACRIEVFKGEQNLNEVSELEKNTIKSITENYQEAYGEDFLRGKTLRLSCRAKSCGDVTIAPLKKISKKKID